MILAQLDRVAIDWSDGDLAISGALPATEARIRRAFSQPALAPRSVEIDGGGIEERLVKIAPGTAEHARAVLRKLGARIALDSGD